MSRPTSGQSEFLSFEKFRFTIEVTSLMVLPPYKGAVFHGAFGNAFRRAVCAAPRADCPTCLLRRRCLYVTFFEPSPPPGFPDAGKYSEAPRPYVLNPPLTNRQAFHPGETLDFELVLIGRAIDALPYFVFTLDQMGRMGLGRERGKYELVRADLLRAGETIQVYDGRTEMLTTYPSKAKDPLLISPEDEPITALSLHFLTPVRIKEKGHLVTNLSFPVFFERLTQRLSLLTAFYGSREDLPDQRLLLGHAQAIEVTQDDLYWYDWERYSGRQKTTMKFGGLRGRVRFSGELAHFMQWLRIGEQVNVGQNTTFGLGRFVLEIG